MFVSKWKGKGEPTAEGGFWKGGHPDDHPVLVLRVWRVLATASLGGAAAGAGLMQPPGSGRAGGAGFTPEC